VFEMVIVSLMILKIVKTLDVIGGDLKNMKIVFMMKKTEMIVIYVMT
jgi:hypothetical protein